MDNPNVAKGSSVRAFTSPVGSVTLPGCVLTNEGSAPPMKTPYKMSYTQGGGSENMAARGVGSTPIASQTSLAMKNMAVPMSVSQIKSMPVPSKVPGTDYKP